MEYDLVFNCELGCSLHSIEVIPGKKNMLIFWCEGVPDMSGCIAIAKRVYPDVKTIFCKDEKFGRDTAYFFEDGKWKARK
jgi:hypothetical protein